MNCISYSLFGINDTSQAFDFRSYLRGLEINLRIAEVLYKDWQVCVVTDIKTFTSKYSAYFDYHMKAEKIRVELVEDSQLCLMMLRRLMPAFSKAIVYDRVICRDTDSLLCYRERQAVQYWERGGKIAHAITDSISHNIPLMGGMIGVMSREFREVINCNTFDEMVNLKTDINYNGKGADQEFLNAAILPKVAGSITEHYVLGMPESFRGDCHRIIQDEDIKVEDVWRETNALGFHIGAAGYQTDNTIKFLKEHGMNNEYYDFIEKKFPETFYWQL